MAAPPPPPPPVPLAAFHFDIQRLILGRIPCSADHAAMSAVCRAWRRMMREQHSGLEGRLLTRPPPLPWLLLPPPAPFPGGRTRAACVLSACRVHHHFLFPAGLRFFGTYDGAWILLDNYYAGAGVHWAVNLRTGAIVSLLGELRCRNSPYLHRMVIHAAALSSPPNSTNYVGAAIVSSWREPAPGVVVALVPRHRCVALWRRGSPFVFDFVAAGDGEPGMDAVDVTLIGENPGCFVFVTSGEHLRFCRLLDQEQEGPLLETNWETQLFHPRPWQPLSIHDRYLVVSADQFLMVVRFTPHHYEPTSAFKVFLKTERNVTWNANFPGHTWAWRELNTLGGRMLFVGHGCSRCYNVGQFPGFSEGIYFLDDGKFYDEEVLFGGNPRPYQCSDNGKWPDGRVQRCFPTAGPSDHSAPVWLLP